MGTSQTATSRAVRNYLAAEHLSQTSLAGILGVSQSSVSKRLRGVKPWTLDDIDRLVIAGVLDYDELGMAAS